MKRLIFLLTALISLTAYPQNSKLDQSLLLKVGQPLPGDALITGDNSSFVSVGDWTSPSSVGVLSIDAGRLKVVNNGANYGKATYALTSVIGDSYVFQIQGMIGTTTYWNIYIGTSNGGYEIYDGPLYTNTSLESKSVTFKATATTTYLTVINLGNTNGLYSYFDNATCRKINGFAGTTPQPAFNLANTSAIPTYGHKGNSSYYSFDGVDDVIPFSGVPAFSTGDFAVVAKINVTTLGNWDCIIGGADNGFAMMVNSAGNLSVWKIGVTTVGSSTVTVTAGTFYTVGYKRSGTTGTFYVNGIADAATITDNTDYSVAVTTIGKYKTGSENWFGGGIGSVQAFNYASDVTYYSNPANHLRAVDQGATGVSLVTGNNSTFAGASDWTNASLTTYDALTGGVLTIGASGGLYKYCRLPVATIAGKIYRFEVDVTTVTGNIHAENIAGSMGYGGQMSSADNGTRFKGVGTQIDNNGGLILITYQDPSTGIFDNITLTQLGCVLNLTSEGMLGSPTQSIWRDWYHSTEIALSGATAPRLVKQELEAWRFNGTSAYLSKTGVSDGLTGDATMSFWLFRSRIADQYIFYNTKWYVGLTGSNLYVSRDNSTTVNFAIGSIIDTWQHIVITSTSTGTTSVYLNGTLISTGACGTPVSGTDYTIGKVSTQYLMSIIDGFQINKEIWSQEKITLASSIFQ